MICSVPAVKIYANQFKEYLTLISMVSAFAFSYSSSSMNETCSATKNTCDHRQRSTHCISIKLCNLLIWFLLAMLFKLVRLDINTLSM